MLKNQKIDIRQIPGHAMYSITSNGRIYSHHVNRFIKATKREYNGSGYNYVGLLINSNPRKYKYYYVHRLVLLTYVGPCPKGMEVDHIDLNTSNNLRYVTHAKNIETRRHSNQYIVKRREYTRVQK